MLLEKLKVSKGYCLEYKLDLRIYDYRKKSYVILHDKKDWRYLNVYGTN